MPQRAPESPERAPGSRICKKRRNKKTRETRESPREPQESPRRAPPERQESASARTTSKRQNALKIILSGPQRGARAPRTGAHIDIQQDIKSLKHVLFLAFWGFRTRRSAEQGRSKNAKMQENKHFSGSCTRLKSIFMRS